MSTEQEPFHNEPQDSAAELPPDAAPVVQAASAAEAAEGPPAEGPGDGVPSAPAQAAADDAPETPAGADTDALPAHEDTYDAAKMPHDAAPALPATPLDDQPGAYDHAPDATAAYNPEYDQAYSVEAALAALTTLNELAAPTPADEAQAAPGYGAPPEGWHSSFRQPPLSALDRGQAASVVPALLLVGIGVFFTILLTSGLPLPAPDIVAGIALGAVGICLIAAWVSSGRWARGNLFMGVVCLVGGALLAIL